MHRHLHRQVSFLAKPVKATVLQNARASHGTGARDEHMHVRTDLCGRRQRLGRLVGKVSVVVICQKKRRMAIIVFSLSCL